MHTDTEIQKQRSLKHQILAQPELVEMRREIQRLYADQADASRRAAAVARHMGGSARGEKRIAETDEIADVAYKAWLKASLTYEALRARLLEEAGVVEEVVNATTTEERARDEAFKTMRLTCPPIGWGLTRYPELADRVAAWQARPAWMRLSDTNPRIAV